VILVPIVGSLILSSDKVQAKRLRKIVILVGISIEVVVLVGMLFWAFYVRSVAGLGALFEVSLTLIGAILIYVMAKIKGDV
jgi:hypothetical protein